MHSLAFLWTLLDRHLIFLLENHIKTIIVLCTRVTRTPIGAQIPVPVLFTQLSPLTMQVRSWELRSRLLYFHTLCNLASSAISKHHNINMKRNLCCKCTSCIDIDIWHWHFSGVNSVYSTSVCSPLDPTCVMTKYVNQCLLNKDEFFRLPFQVCSVGLQWKYNALSGGSKRGKFGKWYKLFFWISS